MLLLALLLGACCLCGEAPERANDFFWENDRVGFRAYGPGDVHKWSGIDVFNKAVSTNLVVHWLREPGKHGNWHLNRNGLGMDDYAVGPGRGVGGIVLRKDGKWLGDYGNWVHSRVIENGNERCSFELDYKLPIGGMMTLAITLERGSSLFSERVRFSRDTPLEGLEVGVGLDCNPARGHCGDLVVDAREGLVSLYEKPHNKPGEEGEKMSALLAFPCSGLKLAEEPRGATVLMTPPLKAHDYDRDVISVYAGADWSCAGRYTSPEQWHRYVRTFRESLRVSKAEYLNFIEAAVGAYSDKHLATYLADVQREGVQEHGFPRLAANLGLLIADGRCRSRRALFQQMMDACCRDVHKEMPPKGGGNEFSVKELVQAIVALEQAKAYAKPVTDAWRAVLTAVKAEDSYTTGRLPVGLDSARNWVVFAAASEQSRIRHGMGGDPAFVEKYVADQLRWFDANGMYRDPNQPAVYDFVTRLQFAQILSDGYNGPSRAKLEAMMAKSAGPTLKMLSTCGEIPYGGRSNQFLHNNTFYAALCEWYAREGAPEQADAFHAAARKAVEALRPWLAEEPLSHVKNRYVRELGKAVYSAKGDMGCERYAYFDKYMVTMGSWAALGAKFAGTGGMCRPPRSAGIEVFETTSDFHFAFLRAGDYSAQFDYNSDAHYDCDGLGRLQHAGAPVALCLAAPCTRNPSYRIEGTNATTLALAPVTTEPLRYHGVRVEGDAAVCRASAGDLEWTLSLSRTGLVSELTGKGPLALALPAFAFDGRESPQILADAKTLGITYRGWTCRYETDGEIVDTGLTLSNRNGRYRRFEARGTKALKVRVSFRRAR